MRKMDGSSGRGIAINLSLGVRVLPVPPEVTQWSINGDEARSVDSLTFEVATPLTIPMPSRLWIAFAGADRKDCRENC